MPIITLQKSMRRLGRVRMGSQVPAANGKTRPNKLETWRMTSPSQELLEAAAVMYGGEVKEWADAPSGRQWELFTDASAIEVIIPPGDMAFSQWFEMWSGGGCQRRCDGQTEIIGDTACVCPADVDERLELAGKGKACKPTTRLFVIQPRLPDVGLWHFESHGFYAATEIPGTINIIRAAAANGTLIPARLRIEQRTMKRDGETKNFAVPVIELPTMTTHTLMTGEIIGGEIGPAPDDRRELPVASPPTASTTPPAPAPSPAPAPAGDGSAFGRVIRGKAARLGMDAAALDSLARGVVGKTLAEIASHEDANKVLAALDGKTPAPAPAADPDPEKPKARRTRSPGSKLHADLGRLKFTDNEQDAIIYCATSGRTESSADLSEQETLTAYQMGQDVSEGRITMETVRSANDDHRAKQAAGDKAVDEYEKAIAS
ncbi:MAG TPA: hypothetical protein VHT75_19455 [Acidimicrobiales bacterium]|jgi:hypothetical protein|nr:hypothetical protein [Acidimicrobiales bacterium]